MGVYCISDLGVLLEDLCELGQGLLGIAVLDTVLDAMVDVPHKYDLTDLVYRTLDRINLNEYLLAGYILVYEPLEARYLPGNPLQAPVKIVGIHALLHVAKIQNYVKILFQ